MWFFIAWESIYREVRSPVGQTIAGLDMAEMKEKLQELSTDSEPATSSGNKVNQKVPCQHNTIDTDKVSL